MMHLNLIRLLDNAKKMTVQDKKLSGWGQTLSSCLQNQLQKLPHQTV